jgi:hypothetical protein
MKKTLAIALLAITPVLSYAEDAIVKEKKLEHSVGVQVNELIRQVFNFSNTNAANNNPYLLTYSINKIKNGWGLRLGAGYNVSTITNDNGVSAVETKIDDLNLRLGAEKKFNLSDKWSTGVGVDALYNNDKNDTKSVTRSFDTTTVTTKSLITSYGGGVMAWLRYNITSKVQIGTETSFYYRTGFHKEQIDIVRKTGNGIVFPQTTSSSTKKDDDIKEGKFNLPVAFYLIVRF